MNFWNIAGAKVQGPSHVQTGTPCQDAFVTQVSSDGQWVSLVVSDGAGSAARAEEGSKLVTQIFSEKLLEIANLLNTRPPGGWINDYVIQQMVDVRELLRKKVGTDDIKDFHCTLVASLVGPSGGFLIHIGDGSLIGGTVEEGLSDPKSLHLKINVQSKPENGEYANETFFVTEKDWIKHLRITPIGKVDWLLLATDGGCALCLKNESSPQISNIEEMVQYLLKTPEENRSKAIESWLGTDGAKQLSNDDKTFVICMSNKFQVFDAHQIKVTNLLPEVTTSAPVISSATSPVIKNLAFQGPATPALPKFEPTIGTYLAKSMQNPFNLKMIFFVMLALAVSTGTLLMTAPVNKADSPMETATIPSQSQPKEPKMKTEGEVITDPKQEVKQENTQEIAKERPKENTKATSDTDKLDAQKSESNDGDVVKKSTQKSANTNKADTKLKDNSDARHKSQNTQTDSSLNN